VDDSSFSRFSLSLPHLLIPIFLGLSHMPMFGRLA
jgi:hypothetical protein